MQAMLLADMVGTLLGMERPNSGEGVTDITGRKSRSRK
jgi:hypothetical protein